MNRFQPPYADASRIVRLQKAPHPVAILWQDPLVPVGICELQRFTRGDYQCLGIPKAWTPQKVREFGMHPASAIFDERDQYFAPADASERVRVLEAQRCVDIQSLLIVPTGVVFELVRYDIPVGAVGVLERIPTILEVQALDDQGEVIFTYPIEQTNGRQPCLRFLTHPDEGVGALFWTWHLTTSHVGWLQGVGNYLGPIPPHQIEGAHLIPPWSDLRVGHVERWGDRRQILVGELMEVRLWLELRGATGRWSVHAGGQLGGYWQSAGRKGAALGGVLTRIV